jgi:hypothetical protein
VVWGKYAQVSNNPDLDGTVNGMPPLIFDPFGAVEIIYDANISEIAVLLV